MAGHGGGAWKVAYADFVTAMMAFFLVMWITAQSNAVKQSIAKYFEHPFDAASRSPIPSKSSSGSSLLPTSRPMDGTPPHSSSKGKSPRGGGMLADHEPPIDPANVAKSGGLRKRSGFMLRDGDPSGIGNVLLFSDDSADLDNRAKQILNELIPVFQGKMNKIEIRGHTSGQAEAGEESRPDRWRLSYDRCQVVMKFLEERGVEPKRIRLSQAGIYEPPAPEKNANGQGLKASDSRVEVYMLPEYVDDYLGRGGQEVEAPENAAASAGKAGAKDAEEETNFGSKKELPAHISAAADAG